MDNIVREHCNECGGERKHTILNRHVVTSDIATTDSRYTVTETNEYSMLKCGGCESVQLKHRHHFSEDDESSYRYYPGHMPRRLPEWIWQCVPRAGSEMVYIGKLLREIYAAISVDACTVAAMGVRALIEFVMVSKVNDQGTFAKNLDAFAAKGFVSAHERARLDRILDLGSAAIHRAFVPTPRVTLTLLEIAEHIIAAIYLHDDAVDAATRNVPPRVSAPKQKKSRP